MLKKTDHCKLCDHHKKNLEIGIICDLTDKPPAFNNSCNQIKLDEIFLEEVESVNISHYKINNRKFDIIGGIVLFPLIGIIVLLLGYWFYKNQIESHHVTRYSSYIVYSIGLIFIVGITLITKGTGPWFNYKKDKKNIDQKKGKLDAVCRLNGVKYEIEYYKKKNPFDLEVHVKNIQLKKTAIIR